MFILFTCGAVFGNEILGYQVCIVGGFDTRIERHPYQLSLRHYNLHICGATIISANWALTAAHCLKNRLADDLSINAGSTYVHQIGSLHKVKRTFMHPLYKNIDYDYALIEVTVPFPIGQPNIQSIELATVEPKEGDLADITGWGNLKTRGTSPEQLQLVTIPIISRDVCAELYSQYYVITDRYTDTCTNPVTSEVQALTGHSRWSLEHRDVARQARIVTVDKGDRENVMRYDGRLIRGEGASWTKWNREALPRLSDRMNEK
ncbi:uncharacterized protein CBL_05365 [Carabus blaptoides fortunei]